MPGPRNTKAPRRENKGLTSTGSKTVYQLAEPFGVSQQAISKHLVYLERANLIEKRRQGRQHFCTLRPKALEEACDWMDSYRQFWEIKKYASKNNYRLIQSGITKKSITECR